MSEIFHCFASPSSRLQLLILLNSYSSDPSFPTISPTLAAHPLLNSLILSLEVDDSSTACTVGLTLFTKLIPIFAVHAPDVLKKNLPHFFLILARVACWEARQPYISLFPDVEMPAEEGEDTEEGRRDLATLEIIPHLEWQRLESTFKVTASTAPSADRYFTHLYYLFPHNVVEFIRHPIQYLDRAGTECPYVAGWDQVLDDEKVQKSCEVGTFEAWYVINAHHLTH